MEELLNKLLGLLEGMNEERGVPRDANLIDDNITNSTSPNAKGNVSPVLKNNEKRRLVEVFNIFNKMFFEQQAKVEGDKKGETLITKLDKKQKEAELPKEKKGFDFLGLLLGGAALAAVALPMLLGGIFQQFGNLSGAFKVLGKLGLVGGLKLLAKTFLKALALPILKRLPIIGSLFSFYEAWDNFTHDKPGKGILNLISGIVGLVPVAGPYLSIGVDLITALLEAKGMFDPEGALSSKNLWPTIKGWMTNIGNFLWDNALYIPFLGGIKRFTMAYDAFQGGNNKEGIKQLLFGLVSFSPMAPFVTGFEMLASFLSGRLSEPPKELNEDSSWSDRLIEWIREKLKVLPWWIKKPLSWFGIIPDDMVDAPQDIMTDAAAGSANGFENISNYVTSMWDSIKGPMKDSIDKIGTFMSDFWSELTSFASKAWDKVKEITPKVMESVGNTADKAWEATKEAGSTFMDTTKDLYDKTTKKASEWMSEKGGFFDKMFGDEARKKMEDAATKTVDTLTDKVASQAGAQVNFDKSATDNFKAAINTLIKNSHMQTKFLGQLVNIETMALKELQRMNGSRGAPQVVALPVPQQSDSSEITSMGFNRVGYASSPYAL